MHNVNLAQIIHEIRSWLEALVTLALLLLLVGTTAKMGSHPIPYLPTVDPMPLAYLMGAWYLYKRAP